MVNLLQLTSNLEGKDKKNESMKFHAENNIEITYSHNSVMPNCKNDFLMMKFYGHLLYR